MGESAESDGGRRGGGGGGGWVMGEMFGCIDVQIKIIEGALYR